MNRVLFFAVPACSIMTIGGLRAAEFENLAPRARAFRQGQPVPVQPDGIIVAEAEEFQPAQVNSNPGEGWKAQNWGENYYAATMANTFLSRKAFLGVPEQCGTPQTATIAVEVPRAGQYLALVRYEAAYRFETQFKLRVEQAGAVKLERRYGARENIKIWAFKGAGQGTLQKEVAWDWGAVENIVWEGHDAAVDLEAGRATLTLIADRQPQPAARRNIDLVLLTADEADVKERIEKENYLPLDGLLTQAGDVFMRIINHEPRPIAISADHCTEHSPYWVHLRRWKPVKTEVAASGSSEWIDVGGLLDSLNDGQWSVSRSTNPPAAQGESEGWTAEFAIRNATGSLEPISRFKTKAARLDLAYDANTRYSRRIRLIEDVLYDLLDYLKKQPSPGAPPERTIVYGGSFSSRPDDPRYTAARDEFNRMFSLQAYGEPKSRATDMIDLRGQDPAALETQLKKIADSGKAGQIRVVSLGDEIGLSAPAGDVSAGFRAWAQARGLKAGEIDPAAGDEWGKIAFDTNTKNPRLYYYSRLYEYQFGIDELKTQTDLIKRYLPRADTGANFSPHHGPPYLGSAHKWISLFRQGGMTLPWSEDYSWQVPVATQQMTTILLDLMRFGNRYHPERAICFYVMPHWPGNTVKSWRRLFYGAIGHGATIINLFEFRPVQTAYTENHVSLPEMYAEVRRSLAELARFEDIVQDGRIHKGEAALWYSQAGDAWDNHASPFGAGKRTLYVAARHRQLGVDIIDEEDALNGTLKDYAVLYLSDRNVSRAAAGSIAAWVKEGGRLFVTAGGAMRDEFNEPNTIMQQLLGVQEASLEIAPDPTIYYEKQDLPFASPVEHVMISRNGGEAQLIPVFGAISRVTPANDAAIAGRFKDGSPALTHRRLGPGTATYCAFLPGLSYFKPAIPMRPVDRGSTDDAMAHTIPCQFDTTAADVIGEPAKGVAVTVRASVPTVEAMLKESSAGRAIVLVNWSGAPVSNLVVSLCGPTKPQSVRLASGNAISSPEWMDGAAVFTLDSLDVADALILR